MNRFWKIAIPHFFVSFVGFLLTSEPAMATDSSTGWVSCQSPTKLANLDWKLYFADRIGSGIGYKRGYSSVGFLTYFPFTRHTPFLDFRFHYLHSRHFAGNFGVGFCMPGPRQFAGAFYVDILTKHQTVFSQFTSSWQWLSRYIGMHINASLCLKERHKSKQCCFDYDTGERIGLSYFDLPFHLIDIRFSTGCFGTNFEYWRAFVGGYYLLNHCSKKNCPGALAKFIWTFCEGTSLDAQWSYDKIFQHRFSVGIAVQWNFDRRGCLKRDLRSCCNYPLWREEIIPIQTRCCWRRNYED